MDALNNNRNIREASSFSPTPSPLLASSQRQPSRRRVHSVGPEINMEEIQSAIEAARDYFSNIQEKENASNNKPGAYRIDSLGRETSIKTKS